MKKILLTLIIFLISITAFPQLVITDGTDLYLEPGTTLVVTTGINTDNATLWNFGTIDLKGNLVNNSGSLFDANSTGTFKFSGTSAQVITGDHDAGFYGITEIDNNSGLSLTAASTGANQTLNGELKFTSGKLTLNEFNLLLGNWVPIGFSADRYVVTNNAGSLQRIVYADGVSAVHFPVGNSSYNPVILQNSTVATTDTYGVRIEDKEPAGSFTPHFVNRSWIITEDIAGGSELTLIPYWNSGEELSDFDRDSCAVGLVVAGGPIYEWAEFGPALGDDPYYREGTGFTDVGIFAVGDYTNIPLFIDSGQALAENNLTCYPNPFKNSTIITFSLPTAGKTTLKIYNSSGIEVATLFEGTAEANHQYNFTFNACSLSEGVYGIHLKGGKNVNVVKKVFAIK